MLFYILILSVLCMLSPFVGLIMLMIYAARNVAFSLVKPFQSLFVFFLLPLLTMILDTGISTRVAAFDAIFGAGMVALVFLLMLKRNHVLSDAMLVSFLALAAYGVLRFRLFGAYESQLMDQGIKTLRTQMPAMLDNPMLGQMLPVWKMLNPAIWTISQGLAMVVGYLLFQRMLKVPSVIENLRFPGLYNLLILAIIPLYLVEQTRWVFINALLTLCFIPLLQGFSLLWGRLGLIFNNRVFVIILMIIITLYASILLVLVGFADMWLQKRNSIPGGTTA